MRLCCKIYLAVFKSALRDISVYHGTNDYRLIIITKSSSDAGRTRRRLALLITLLYVETYVWTCACVTKSGSSVSCS